MNALTLPTYDVQGFFPSPEEWKMQVQMAQIFVASGLLPKSIKNSNQALLIMQKGRELRIPPAHALAHLHVVDNKVGMSAEIMMALILRDCPDARFELLKNDNTSCRIRAERRQFGKAEFGFSIEDAAVARLKGKDNWEKYPRAMLRSRAIAEMGRSMFPDCIGGMSYTPEELAPDKVIMDEGGNIVSIIGQEIIDVKSEASKPSLEERIKKKFEDEEKWWRWLDKAAANNQIPAECMPEIREVVVGQEVAVILQLLNDVREGRPNSLLGDLF